MTIHAWHVFWLCWFFTSFGVFLGFESYGLATKPERTLSAAIWSMEHMRRGQPITAWTFLHLAFIVILLFVDIWLLGHFAFGWWR